MIKAMTMALAVSVSMVAQADIMTFVSGSKTIEGVNLSAKATTEDGAKLDILGAGLRNKKVLVMNAKVYVLQLFSDNKASFSRDANALNSLVSKSKNIGLKISMLRTVEASSLAVSFKEAIQANGFAIDNELTKLLSVIESGADGIQGKDLLITLAKTSDVNSVNFAYQDAKGTIKTLNTSASAMAKVLSIWLGKPADSGLADLKNQLLNPVY